MNREPLAVLVPLVNPNETECLLAELKVSEGQWVKCGDSLGIFETTKTTLEMNADSDGVIRGLNVRTGDLLRVGSHFCWIADSPDQVLPMSPVPMTFEKKSQGDTPPGLKITQPALAHAKQLGIPLASLPTGILITERYITDAYSSTTQEVDPRRLVIYGGGGHAKSLIDLIRAEGKFLVEGILDDNLPPGHLLLDVPVLGGSEVLPGLRTQGIGLAVNAVGGIGNITPRLVVYKKLHEAGFECMTVVHPRAFIEPNASVSAGCQVFFNAYIGSSVKVGYGCILNTGAIISHDCVLGKYVNISPGAILAGAVQVGERALVGMGVTINLGVQIGAGARVGNSAVVKADLPENGIVRAGGVWPQTG